MVFGWFIVGYLFVAGVAAGAFFVSFATCLWDRWRSSAASERATSAVQGGFHLAPCLALLAILLLLVDLGNPNRLLMELMSPFDSVIGAGTWLLGLFFVFSTVLSTVGALHSEVPRSFFMLFGLLASVCAIGVMAYTGVLLSSLVSIEFWYTPWLVALFIASSLTTGASAVVLFDAIVSSASTIRNLGGLWRTCSVLAAIEAVVLFGFMWSQAHGTPMAVQSCAALLQGSLAVPFWAGICLVGFVVPWVLHAFKPIAGTPAAMMVSSVGVLIGGFLLRYCIVGAGLFSPLVLGSVAQVL